MAKKPQLSKSAGNWLGWHTNFCHHPAMRVLIADDQRSVGTSLAELVRRCQHEVVEIVTSGLEAIQAYGRHHPDVVLMDYQMPKLNGATACRNIVAKYPEARVILVSGYPRDVADSGALRVLQKPVELDTLYAALYDAAQPRTSA
jgi:CheY-like chemotaxis protein